MMILRLSLAVGLIAGFTGQWIASATASPYGLDPHVHAEDEFEIVEVVSGTEVSVQEVAASDVLLPVVLASTTTRGFGSQWDFIGVPAGATYWRLPKNQNTDVLYLSIATEELNPADFASLITFSLLSVTGTNGGPAPGFFSVWDTGDDGPEPLMSTFVGTTPNSLSVGVNTHNHFNYGFTAAGLYNVELLVSGTLSASLGGGRVEGTATYSFGVFDQDDYPVIAETPYVFAGRSFPYFMYDNAHADIGVSLIAVPEPASVALAGLGAAGALAAGLRRRRRAAVVAHSTTLE
jgi:hypothetical protein